MNGKEVTLIDSVDRILNKYLDPEFTDAIEDTLTGRGIKLALGQTVQKFTGENGKVTKVITSKGEFETDLVILCIGFRPNTELLKGQVDMLPNGAIIVDKYMQTSQKTSSLRVTAVLFITTRQAKHLTFHWQPTPCGWVHL